MLTPLPRSPIRLQVRRLRNTSQALGHLALASARGQPRATRLLGMFLLGGVGVGPYLSPAEVPTDSGGEAGLAPSATAPVPGQGLRSAGASPRLQRDIGNAAFEALAVGANPSERSSATALGVGLLHLAAVLGDAPAQVALGLRYKHGELKAEHQRFALSSCVHGD
jgi:TPR repeat protein